MILYEVKYKKINSFFWKKIKNVKGDLYVEDSLAYTENGPVPTSFKDIRCIILEDESRIEIPANDYIFKFSKERHYSLKDRMDSEANIDIKLKKE